MPIFGIYMVTHNYQIPLVFTVEY